MEYIESVKNIFASYMVAGRGPPHVMIAIKPCMTNCTDACHYSHLVSFLLIGAQSIANEIIKFKNEMEGTESALKFVINAGDSFYSLGVTKTCETAGDDVCMMPCMPHNCCTTFY